jgi:hypothetical protein
MATVRTVPLPAELPEKPVGWKKRMSMHMKLTGGGGMASYDMTDDKGELMPIGYGYCINRENPEQSGSGFFLHGAAGDSYLSWVELRAAWPAYFQLLHR